jgi:hypothetical protein
MTMLEDLIVLRGQARAIVEKLTRLIDEETQRAAAESGRTLPRTMGRHNRAAVNQPSHRDAAELGDPTEG